MKSSAFVTAAVLLCTHLAAEEPPNPSEPPPDKLLRAAEDYSSLAHDEDHQYEDDWFDPIKYIPLTDDRNVHLTVGGEFRGRHEHCTTRNWTANADEGFYSQRISAHAILRVGDQFRFVPEFYHGYNSGEKEFAPYDELDWHQGYAELISRIPGSGQLTFRLGRQEMAFGASRLVGIREGLHIRRTFDAAHSIFTINGTTLDAFFG